MLFCIANILNKKKSSQATHTLISFDICLVEAKIIIKSNRIDTNNGHWQQTSHDSDERMWVLISVVKPATIIKRHIIFVIYTHSQWIERRMNVCTCVCVWVWVCSDRPLILHNTCCVFFQFFFSHLAGCCSYYYFWCCCCCCCNSAALTYHIDHSVRTCYWLDINTIGCIHARRDHASSRLQKTISFNKFALQNHY